MDYRRAQSLKKKSLWQLTKERDIAGKGMIGGFKSAVSDKWEAKKTRFKEKFDPLNMSRFMFGKYLTAKMGKAMGRSPDDIDYFTGYNVGRSYKYKYRAKDPKRSSIGPGRVMPLRMGDSETDVLAKIYNFMVKQHDLDLKNYETEKLFREEQLEEDERRHKKLLESLTKKKTTDGEKDGGDSWLSKFFSFAKDMMKSILAPIWGFLKFVGGVGKDVFGLIGSVIATAVEKVAEIIIGSIGELIKDTMSFFIHKVKDWVVMNILKRVQYLLADLAAFIIDLLPAGKAYSLAKWVANLTGAAITADTAKGAIEQIRETRDQTFVDPNLRQGAESIIAGIEEKYKQKAKQDRLEGKDLEKSREQRREEKAKEIADLYQSKQDKYFKEVVEPKIKDKYIVDYSDMDDYTTASGIDVKIPKIYEKNGDGSKGQQTWLWTLAPALQMEEAVAGYIKDKSTEIKVDVTGRVSSAADEYVRKPLLSLSDAASSNLGQVLKRFEVPQGDSNSAVNNTTNVSTGTTEFIDPTPLSARNPDKTLEICNRNWAPSL